MSYLCTNCLYELDFSNEAYENYDRIDLDDRTDVYHIYCPQCGKYELHEIDDLMMYPIRTLNLKGYITSYCCSGHGWENKPNTYISFLNKNYVPPTLPIGFTLEDDEYYKMMGWNKSNNRVCIRKYYHPIDKYLGEYSYLDRPVLEKEILKTALDLIDWVDKLPYRHEV